MKENSTYFGQEGDKNLPDSFRENPFSVPENYFSDLAGNIQSIVKLTAKTDPESNPFTVPTGYFEGLSSVLKMEIKKDGIFRKTGFTTPADYFENAQQAILGQVKIESIQSPEEIVFQTAPNYFNTLQSRIMNAIEEDKGLDSVEEDGFSVPAAYFENAKVSILAKIKEDNVVEFVPNQQEETPVRKISVYRKWSKYVAAACLVSILGIGSYSYLNSTDQPTLTAATDNTELSEIPDEEIANYLAQSGDAEDLIFFSNYNEEIQEDHSTHAHDEDGICENVKEKDIEDYLNYML
ncbi:hypothetical protein [Sphingobacterium hungaricum]|uniref:Uncharacterized protein n=1 Tax=Sphingobacterium hungaricum TaxID=2082723 RepID=A0A928YPS0_9SPHI|nr:hypothetical protein [Sphingobacterium hungaricum]MBE8712842.1 hypothetical protein [Sphingobacterium hungaricum]